MSFDWILQAVFGAVVTGGVGGLLALVWYSKPSNEEMTKAIKDAVDESEKQMRYETGLLLKPLENVLSEIKGDVKRLLWFRSREYHERNEEPPE